MSVRGEFRASSASGHRVFFRDFADIVAGHVTQKRSALGEWTSQGELADLIRMSEFDEVKLETKCQI